MAKAKANPKPKAKVIPTIPMLPMLQKAFAVYRVDNGFMNMSHEKSSSKWKMVQSSLPDSEYGNMYDVIDEDIENANKCVEHFQALAIKYMADTIQRYELRLFVIVGSEMVTNGDLWYIAAMPQQYFKDSSFADVSRQVRFSKGPIPDVVIDEPVELNITIISVDFVSKYNFYSYIALTDEGYVVRFANTNQKFLRSLSYRVSAKIKEPVAVEFVTKEQCTALRLVKIT